MSSIDNILTQNKYSKYQTPSVTMANMVSKVKVLRKKEKYSQQQLAIRSGVSLGSIKRFERTGQISFESLLRIAHVFDRLSDFDDVFGYDDKLDRVRAKMNSQ